MNRMVLLTLAAMLYAASPAGAQGRQGQALLDSLLAELPEMREDTNGVKLIDVISDMYVSIDPNEGLKWAAREKSLAMKIGWRKGECMAYNNLGNNYQAKAVYPAALEAFFNSLRIAEALGNKRQIGNISCNIGNVYHRQGELPKSLDWYFKTLKIGEETGSKRQMQAALGNIGIICHEQSRNGEAIGYMLRALRIGEELDDKMGIIIQTGNIASVYVDQRQYAIALVYDFKSVRLAEEVGDKTGVAIGLSSIGEVYRLIAADSAAPKADSLIPASRAANLDKAIDYLSRGVAAEQEAEFYEVIQEGYLHLSEAYSLRGDYQSALKAYKRSVELNDSLHNGANSEKIANLETLRAVELKDKDILIAKLKKRNERVLFTAGFAVLLLVLGIVLRSFRRQRRSNRMLAEEKRRSDELLLNILPAEVAEELKDHGNAEARQFDNVSVLFTDFVNFTGTAEQLSPHVLVKELHECFSAFDAIMEKTGLEKIKTVGDAYLAVCGLPNADPRHAQHCVEAAMGILQFLEERSRRERVFGIRIGIHSGPLVAGIVGIKKFAYDIWGDTVNTAARMEQHGEPGRINISQSTYELVKNDYRCSFRGTVAAKNKGEVPMYFVEESVRSS